MLMHVGLTIAKKEDIERFYVGLLGFRKAWSFKVTEEVGKRIFKQDALEDSEVVAVKREDLAIELFMHGRSRPGTFDHLCIALEGREEVVEKAAGLGYTVHRIKREGKKDLIFIEDGSGNRFEIVEKKA